jgi:putative flippase GtrA
LNKLKWSFPRRRESVFPQIIRFGIVGGFAAIINMLVVVWLVRNFNMQPLLANIFAFLIAFNISYTGHHYWSFANAKRKYCSSVSRFLVVAIMSFILNEGLFYIFLRLFSWYYVWALLLTLLIVPIFSFICSKFWAFKT